MLNPRKKTTANSGMPVDQININHPPAAISSPPQWMQNRSSVSG